MNTFVSELKKEHDKFMKKQLRKLRLVVPRSLLFVMRTFIIQMHQSMLNSTMVMCIMKQLDLIMIGIKESI